MVSAAYAGTATAVISRLMWHGASLFQRCPVTNADATYYCHASPPYAATRVQLARRWCACACA